MRSYRYLDLITALFVTVLIISNIASTKILTLGTLTLQRSTLSIGVRRRHDYFPARLSLEIFSPNLRLQTQSPESFGSALPAWR
jgi:hypothetical protein